ncbi:MAG: phosphatidylserine decarboxylase family protein [Bacteroidales bacterium]|nr:phosphatidylserine decarboxylase family protein [Bacteroidales bacterium]
MKIHKEGYLTIGVAFFLIGAVETLLILITPGRFWLHALLFMAGVVFFGLIVRFFRDPQRQAPGKRGEIISGADGKVVAIEEVMEKEYFHEKRIQVSVFMSPFDVHVNWYPVSGTVKYFRHMQGSYLIASHPKSSEQNERTSVVVETDDGYEILFRQIAGTVARRIISNAKENKEIISGDEAGFIRFGSRFDLYLPLDSKILVTYGEKVTGCHTVIARLPETRHGARQQGQRQ